MTTSPDVQRHILYGQTNAVYAWFGLFISILVAIALWQLLSGWTPTPFPEPFEVAGVKIPWESFIPLVALAVYWMMRKVSLNRPRTTLYIVIDLIGSVVILVVVCGALASWFPFFRPMFKVLGLPTMPTTLTTILLVAWFLPLGLWDIWYNHIVRAVYGREALLRQSDGGTGEAVVRIPASTDGTPRRFTLLEHRPGYELKWRDDPIEPSS